MVVEVGKTKVPIGTVSASKMVSSIQHVHGRRTEENEPTPLSSFLRGLILFTIQILTKYILNIPLMLPK